MVDSITIGPAEGLLEISKGFERSIIIEVEPYSIVPINIFCNTWNRNPQVSTPVVINVDPRRDCLRWIFDNRALAANRTAPYTVQKAHIRLYPDVSAIWKLLLVSGPWNRRLKFPPFEFLSTPFTSQYDSDPSASVPHDFAHLVFL